MRKLVLLFTVALFIPLIANAQTTTFSGAVAKIIRANPAPCVTTKGLVVPLTSGCAEYRPPEPQTESETQKESKDQSRPGAQPDGEQSQVSAPAAAAVIKQDLDTHSGFKWGSALKQYLLLLAVEHTFDLTQEKTRRELKGPFIKDYFRSVKGLGGWDDGGKFFTNYIAHPMEGGIYGWIQIQNDPKGIKQQVGRSKGYWVSRMKAMAWSAACSLQFEIGPLSQASIGNVGLYTPHEGKGKRKMAYVDIVITPTIGTGWIVGEDLLERYVLKKLEHSDKEILRNTLRTVLTPMRAGANLLRLKWPWYRDK
ncbi:MAG TPA: hypothetical protein VJQ56_02350 [Blastocatellia bacterium]|nr:hypothetical protein [Blastocatellia bacterium]